MNTVLYVLAMLGFLCLITFVITDLFGPRSYWKASVTEDLEKHKARLDELEKDIFRLEEYIKLNVDETLQEILDKNDFDTISLENLGTRAQELDEMIRWYAGELKAEDLKVWSYPQPDGSVKTSSLIDKAKEEESQSE